MLINHVKTAWRTIVKDKTYATINVLGLTIGLCACMLVFTVIVDELSYDKFWSRSEDLYKLYAENKMADGIYQKQAHTPVGLGKALKDNFPEVEQYAAIRAGEQRLRFEPEEQDGVAVRVLNADTNILTMFDFEPIDGRLPQFVAGQKNVLITESLRDRHFNGENPVGRVIEDVPSWSREKQAFLITGVIKDIPQNTHLRADAIIMDMPSNEELSKEGYGTYTIMYYLLAPGADAVTTSKKINDWLKGFIENPERQTTIHGLQPVADVYLNSDYDKAITVSGNQNTLYILTGVGLLLLLIACINFVNLSTVGR